MSVKEGYAVRLATITMREIKVPGLVFKSIVRENRPCTIFPQSALGAVFGDVSGEVVFRYPRCCDAVERQVAQYLFLV